MNIEDIQVEKELNIVFMGTPDFSVPVLEGLIDNYHVKAVITQPDKPVGRSSSLKPSPVKRCANDHDILVIQPVNIKEQFQEVIDLNPDLIVTCAYGQIIPKELLDYPQFGCINVHASLLPKLRGGAPIHRAIIEGNSKTGITIMYMAEGMDTGDIISMKEIPILDTDTASSMHDKLSVLGKELLLETLPSILNRTNNRIPQDESEATYAFNIKASDEKIDFNKSALEIFNQVRGLYSWPGAYAMLDGKRIKIWEVEIGTNYYTDKLNGEITNIYKNGIGVKVSNGEIIIKKLQPEGKKMMDANNYVNGTIKDNLIGKVLS